MHNFQVNIFFSLASPEVVRIAGVTMIFRQQNEQGNFQAVATNFSSIYFVKNHLYNES